ncbi:hypothetical protein [Amycolatopsis jejuensis]|uniref:hypothetical protein n=1 Tax=Amycolatopsis jejuensis TaxID=330084 RepID=UPI0005275417|nr:hypothetical protein [Amycolatopsis jejuensis]
MLYIVLVLVLAALGLLVTALITATSLWAWVSIGLSVLAGLLLLLDWLRRRKREAPAESSEDSKDDAAAAPEEDAEQTELIPVSGELGDPAEVPEPVVEEDSGEETATPEPKAAAKAVRDTPPGVEETDPEDLEVVKELEDEVVVVDEYPRYHLVDCGWLSGRDTIPIGVGEARQLGFTPCARCGPDTVLAAAHR